MHAFDRRTDRQTDRRTDRRTDRIPIAIPRLHSMQRGKNCSRHLYTPKVTVQYRPLPRFYGPTFIISFFTNYVLVSFCLQTVTHLRQTVTDWLITTLRDSWHKGHDTQTTCNITISRWWIPRHCADWCHFAVWIQPSLSRFCAEVFLHLVSLSDSLVSQTSLETSHEWTQRCCLCVTLSLKLPDLSCFSWRLVLETLQASS